MTGITHFFDASRFVSATAGVDGATVSFYYTGTSNLAPIYSDIGLTSPMTNPVVISIGQILPRIYLDPTIEYRRRIVFTSDGSVHDEDPIAVGGDVANAIYQEIAALTGMTVAASAVQGILPTAPTALPYEVTAISGGVGSGSGGTNGTYVGGVSGGPAGFAWTYTIAGGVLASYEITNPGLSTSNTAPTLSLPLGGLTSPTIPTATVGTIPVNRVFWGVTSDNIYIALWKNAAGTLTKVVDSASNQIKIVISSTLADYLNLIDNVTGSGTATVGYTGSLTQAWDSGVLMTAVGGTKSYVIGKVVSSGTLTKVSFGTAFGPGSGTIHILIMEPDTTYPDLKILSSHEVTVLANGQTDFTSADFGTINLVTGQYVGFSIPSGGPTLLGLKNTDPVTYYNNTDYTSGTHTFAPLTANSSLFCRFEQTSAVLQVGGDNFAPGYTSLPFTAVEEDVVQWVIVPILGQSHGEPHAAGKPTIELPAGRFKMYYGSSPTLTDNLTEILRDPVGPTLGVGDNTNYVGIGPAMAREIWARTGYGVILVPCAEGGSGLISEGLGGGRNWSPPGSGASDGGGHLRAEALARIQDAMQAASDAGLCWQLGPIVWTQGGTESLRFDHATGTPWTDFSGNTITAANRTTAMGTLFTWLRTQLDYPNLPVVISMDPPKNTGISAGTLMVNQSIRDYCKSDVDAHLAYTAAQNWAIRSIMSDTYHGTDVAYNEMGAHLGRFVAKYI